jgi:DNA-binding transcriptional MerR regulator
MKRFLTRLIFNQRQREAIWNAVIFSEHTYKRRGDVDNASKIGVVVNEIKNLFAPKEKTFTEKEVNDFMQETIELMNKKIVKVGEDKFIEGVKLGKSMPKVLKQTIDTEKCKDCEHKNDCMVYGAIMEIESEKSKENAEEEKKEDDGDEEKVEEKINNDDDNPDKEVK